MLETSFRTGCASPVCIAAAVYVAGGAVLFERAAPRRLQSRHRRALARRKTSLRCRWPSPPFRQHAGDLGGDRLDYGGVISTGMGMIIRGKQSGVKAPSAPRRRLCVPVVTSLLTGIAVLGSRRPCAVIAYLLVLGGVYAADSCSAA